MEIKVLTNVHEIKCPYCGKRIFLILGETIPPVRKEEEKKVTIEEFKAETPMEAKKKLYEWISKLEVGTTFTFADVRKALGFKEYAGSARGIGNMLRSLVKQGYLAVADKTIGKDGLPRTVYKVKRKIPF